MDDKIETAGIVSNLGPVRQIKHVNKLSNDELW